MRRKIIVPNIELLDDVAKIVASGEQVTILTKGLSMLPFIVGGRDSVELTSINDEIRLGDILLAKLSSPETRYVIHRVVEINEGGITLMGDGNLVGREVCRQEDVVARVTSIITPNKTINPNSAKQRHYASIWRRLHPIRRYLLKVFRIVNSIS